MSTQKLVWVFKDSPKPETTPTSTNCEQTDKNVVPPHNGILLRNKKEQTTDTHYNVDELQKH